MFMLLAIFTAQYCNQGKSGHFCVKTSEVWCISSLGKHRYIPRSLTPLCKLGVSRKKKNGLPLSKQQCENYRERFHKLLPRTCSRVAAKPWRSATYGKPWTNPTFSVIWLVMSVNVSGFTAQNQQTERTDTHTTVHVQCNVSFSAVLVHLWCRCRRSTPGRSGLPRSPASGCWSWGWSPLSFPLETKHHTYSYLDTELHHNIFNNIW